MNIKIKDRFDEEIEHQSRKNIKKLDKEQFGNCKVCNNKANGIHYGIASCEGCKVI